MKCLLSSWIAFPALLVLSACESSAIHKLPPPVDDSVELAPGEGRAEALGSCTTCHSLRYITNQPKFARRTWQAEVTKMRKVYGAPVSEEVAPKIVNYLVAAYGVE